MPRLDDDGQTVTLDLHGARVDEAERLAEAAVVQAARHGRQTLRLVHGHSTSGAWSERRTIKMALHEMLDRGAFRSHVTQSLRGEGHLLLGLAPAPTPVRGRLRLADLL